MAQLHQGIAAILAVGQELVRPSGLVLLAEATGHAGQVAEELRLLADGLTAFETSGRGDGLVETYRLQSEILLARESKRHKANVRKSPKPVSSKP